MFLSCVVSYPLGSWVSLWNFETIRGSLMKPKWQKLVWPRKYAHSSFSSLVQSLLPKDTPGGGGGGYSDIFTRFT